MLEEEAGLYNSKEQPHVILLAEYLAHLIQYWHNSKILVCVHTTIELKNITTICAITGMFHSQNTAR
jgi:hypothetical protein